MSKHCFNLLLLKNDEYTNVRHEVIGGALDDYVVNLDDDIDLMAQMGTGANRLYSGLGNDAYSVILDDSKDVIYDRGGENIVAIMLQDGMKLQHVEIMRRGNRYEIYKKGGNPLLEYVFHSPSNEQDKVQFLIKDNTGKEVVFKMLPRPQYVSNRFHYRQDIADYHLRLFQVRLSADSDRETRVGGMGPQRSRATEDEAVYLIYCLGREKGSIS
ncbi:hypothetical protein ACROYT_G008921 [Oculina patagonica]